jgi:hypothetical protein
MLLYADEVSFTVMSARGDALCRLDTFSAFRMDGVTVAQVPLLMRADDPPFGLAMVAFAHRMEDRRWQQTLHNLAAYLGVQAPVADQTLRLDRRRQWSKLGNAWYDAAVRSALHPLAARVRARRPTSTPGRRNQARAGP